MSEQEGVGVINLGHKEIDPEEEAAYREKIRAAKAGKPLSALKGSDVIGGVPRPQMPILQKGQDPGRAPAEGVVPRGPGAPVLRPETAQQLHQAIQAGQQAEEDKAVADAQAAKDKARLEEEERLAKLFENFDFGTSQNAVEKILDNKKRRSEIESRCKSMDFEDLLMKDEVQQRVPIQPGKFEPTYRSLTPVETLYLKTRMARETVQSDMYLAEKYSLLLLCCSLTEINGVPFPDHRKHKSDGSFEIDDKAFDEKMAAVMKKSVYILADLSVNYGWFDLRVRKLLNPDALGNG